MNVKAAATSQLMVAMAGGAIMPTRVAIVDEHEMFALGLHACLVRHPLIEIVDRDDASVHVAIVSPEAAGEQSFDCPLVVCGEPPARLANGNMVLAALPRRTLTGEHLLACVQAVAAGLRVAGRDEDPPTPRLEARSLAVLKLLAQGEDTRAISVRLGYSDRTIKSVIRELQVVLGARNRVQAVAEGVRQGLI